MNRFFPRDLRFSFLLLGIAEIAAFVSSGYLGAHLRLFVELGRVAILPEELEYFGLRLFVFTLTMFVSLVAMGLYTRDHLRLPLESIFLRIATGYFVGIVMLSVIFYVIPELYVGRGISMISNILSFLLISSLRFAFLQVIDQDPLKRRVLIYGSGSRAKYIEQYLLSPDKNPGIKVLGFIHAEGDRNVVESQFIMHPKGSLLEFAKQSNVDEIVVAVDDRRANFPIDDLLGCRMLGINVNDLPTFFENETSKVSLELITPSWLIFSNGFKHSALSVHIKAAFDVLTAAVLFILTLPIMVLTALAIKIESGWRSSVLYRQVRVGQADKHFEILKFRSMVENAESDGKAQWAKKDDPRVTRVGDVIRKFRIDELPQIINVLRGDMSFVGPRPERPEFVQTFTKKFPYYGERHHVKPGVTGWAQLCYPYGDTDKDALEKLKFDLYYAKNYSLLFDLLILILTVEVILFRKGSR